MDAIAAADAPVAFRARVALAALRETAEDMLGAITYLEAALADDPFHPADRVDVYSQLGRAYAAVGRPQQAVELFERCLEDSDGRTLRPRRGTRRC